MASVEKLSTGSYLPLARDYAACMYAKLLQSCPTLCDPVDCSQPGSSLHGILQVRNAGVGFRAFLQGIFPTQGSNLHSLLSPALASRSFTTRAAWEDQRLPYGALSPHSYRLHMHKRVPLGFMLCSRGGLLTDEVRAVVLYLLIPLHW